MRRVLLAACIIAAAVLYLFTGARYASLLASAALVLPCAALALGAMSARGARLALIIPARIRKGEPARCKLILENRSLAPIALAALRITIKNHLTNKEQELAVALSAAPNKKIEYGFTLESSTCGQYEFICGEFRIVDFLGLRGIRKQAGIKETRVSMPDTFRTYVFLSDANSSLVDGDSSSINKKGPDHTEPLQYRDFADGDPMNRINYKLSFKHDRLMIADGSQPRKDAYLVLWNGGLAPAGAPPSVPDALAEAFISICSSLVDAGIPYTAAWKSSESGGITQMEVASRDDMYDVIKVIMRTGGVETQVHEYLRAFGGKHYPTVAYFSYRSPNELGILNGIGRVTPFICKQENEPADGEGCFFTPGNYRSVLSRVYI
jgi:hypothetical protein